MPAQTSLAAPPATHRTNRKLAWLAPVLLLAGAMALIATQLPAPLVLPAASTLLVAAGLALAIGLYLTGSRLGTGRSAAWDAAGALVFLGFAAALLTESEPTLALFDQLQTHGLAALAR